MRCAHVCLHSPQSEVLTHMATFMRMVTPEASFTCILCCTEVLLMLLSCKVSAHLSQADAADAAPMLQM